MKKIFLLLILLLAGISVNAEDWIPVDTNYSNFYLYVDKDSIKNTNPQEYLYAVKFQYAEQPEKVAYLKSNIKTNYLGIIRSEIYNKYNYHPKSYFANAHVFMKPIENDSFLVFSHNYISKLYTEEKTEKSEAAVEVKADAFSPDNTSNEDISEVKQKEESDSKPEIRGLDNNVDNGKKIESTKIDEAKPQQVQQIPQKIQTLSTAADLKEYVAEISTRLNENWQPPKSGQNTQTIIILTIGKDGSLQKYDIAKSSGDEATDRSIISVAEKCVPYAKFSGIKKGADNIKLQFVFEYKKFKKSVM